MELVNQDIAKSFDISQDMVQNAIIKPTSFWSFNDSVFTLDDNGCKIVIDKPLDIVTNGRCILIEGRSQTFIVSQMNHKINCSDKLTTYERSTIYEKMTGDQQLEFTERAEKIIQYTISLSDLSTEQRAYFDELMIQYR